MEEPTNSASPSPEHAQSPGATGKIEAFEVRLQKLEVLPGQLESVSRDVEGLKVKMATIETSVDRMISKIDTEVLGPISRIKNVCVYIILSYVAAIMLGVDPAVISKALGGLLK